MSKQTANQTKKVDFATLSTKQIKDIHHSLHTRFMAVNAVLVSKSTYEIQMSGSHCATVKVVDDTLIIVEKGQASTIKFADKPNLKLFLDRVANSYYSKGSLPVLETKQPEASQAPTTNKTKGVNTMETKTAATYVDVNKIQSALIKNGWAVKDGVYSSKADCHVMFTEQIVTIARDGEKQKIKIQEATDKSLIACIQSLNTKGDVLKHTAIKGLVAPVSATQTASKPASTQTVEREQSPGNKEKAMKTDTAEKAKKEEKTATPPAPPKRPENPNADGATPVFDMLAKAVEVTEKTEKELVSVWAPIATKYAYSVKGLIADIFAEGRWPEKLNKDGIPFEVDGFTVPAGYKGVYDAEAASGHDGPGHLVNRAARMFTKLNPDAKKRATTSGGTGLPADSKNTASDKTPFNPEKAMAEMSRLAAKLSPEDLKSWLNSDQSVLPILNEMIEEAGSQEDLLAGLDS